VRDCPCHGRATGRSSPASKALLLDYQKYLSEFGYLGKFKDEALLVQRMRENSNAMGLSRRMGSLSEAPLSVHTHPWPSPRPSLYQIPQTLYLWGVHRKEEEAKAHLSFTGTSASISLLFKHKPTAPLQATKCRRPDK